MKKVLVFAAAVVMLLAMSACGGNGDAETTAAATDAATEAATDAATTEEVTDAATEESNVAEETTAPEADVTVGEETTAGEAYDYPRAPEDARIGYASEPLYYWIDPATGEEVQSTTLASQIKPGSQRGVKFTLAENTWVSIFSLACPSYSDNVGSLMFQIYRWVEVERTADMDEKAWLKACYAATVGGGDIVAEQLFENFADNETLSLAFEDDLDMTVGNGTFLFVVTNPDEEDHGVGIWNDGFDTDLPFHENNNTYVSDIVHFSGNGNVKTRGYMRMVLELTFIESED